MEKRGQLKLRIFSPQPLSVENLKALEFVKNLNSKCPSLGVLKIYSILNLRTSNLKRFKFPAL